jgi:hypothetical protein
MSLGIAPVALQAIPSASSALVPFRFLEQTANVKRFTDPYKTPLNYEEVRDFWASWRRGLYAVIPTC